MFGEKSTQPTKVIGVRIYGVSGKAVKDDVETITGVNPGKEAIRSRETGRVAVMPEIYSHFEGGAACTGSECDIIFLIVAAVIMAVVAIVWTVVMIVFSIVTIGGFVKRRYRTLVVMEKENLEFIGKLSVMAARRGGVSDYHLGHEEYDFWAESAFSIFKKLKTYRQLSIVLGVGWGLIEIGFKLKQVIIDPSFNYNLWPFRIIMIVIFAPAILTSPYLEFRFKSSFAEGEFILDDLVARESRFNPNIAMTFVEPPIVVEKMKTSIMKKDEESGSVSF